MEYYGGEAYDFTTGEEIKKKKNKKAFIWLTILAVVVLGGIIALLLWGTSYKIEHEVKPLEEDSAEIIAKDFAYQAVIEKLNEFHGLYTNNREMLLEFCDNDYNEEYSYIKNDRVIVYKDGTYQEKVSLAFDGNNTDTFTLGTIDLTYINDYIHQNEEIFKGYLNMKEELREEEEADTTNFIVHHDNGTFSMVDEERYLSAIQGVFFNSDKEIVQNYTLNNAN